MTGLLRTAALAAAVCATSLVCLQAANAAEFTTIYPSYDLYRLPNGSLAVNPAVRAQAYGITAPAYNYGPVPSRSYGITAPAYNYGPSRSYGIAAPAYNYGLSRSYGITAPAYNYGLSRTYGITAPAYSGPVAAGLHPWSPQWYSYCQDRYRTFQPHSGTFTGYDGQQHFCVGS